MKKQLFLPLAATAGGAAALVLRLLQNQTGFEAATGLPVPGNVPGLALAALLAALAVILLILACRLPLKKADPAFPDDFRTEGAGLLFLPVAGLFLIAASGALDILAGAGLTEADAALSALGGIGGPAASFGSLSLFSRAGVSPRVRLLMGVLSLLSAVCLFPAAVACRRRPGREVRTVDPAFLLAPPVCLVIRLVLVYRMDSVNPALQAYYVELLALVFMTLTFYLLASFAYRAARPRRFVLCAAAAVALCLTALADWRGLSTALLHAGGASSLLGFLLLWLAEEPSVPEAVEGDQ